MSLWPEFRALAWLKRAALALERIAVAQETIAAAAASAAASAAAPRPRPAATVFSELDLREAERDWRERRRIEADEAGEPEPEARA